MADGLTDQQVKQFVEEGVVAVEGAFPRAVADAAREILWDATGCDPDDTSTWTAPVIRLGGFGQPPFETAANTPRLHAAFDQLVGAGRWLPRHGLGTCPIRFPHPDDPGDTGWHVDASFTGPDGEYRLNLHSRNRALLMLFLFSDVGADDAPTRVRLGSHLDVPPLLVPSDDGGADFFELSAAAEQASTHRPEIAATGAAGDVYLCHPFLVHAAQPHRGHRPRFIAQPPLHPARPLKLDRHDGDYSPVEQAIRQSLNSRR